MGHRIEKFAVGDFFSNDSNLGFKIVLQNELPGLLIDWAYKSQGTLGIIVLKRGLDKFYDIYYGWQFARDVGTR